MSNEEQITTTRSQASQNDNSNSQLSTTVNNNTTTEKIPASTVDNNNNAATATITTSDYKNNSSNENSTTLTAKATATTNSSNNDNNTSATNVSTNPTTPTTSTNSTTSTNASATTNTTGNVVQNDSQAATRNMLVKAYNISITMNDVNRLEPGEFLNDNIIDFYFQYIQEYVLSKFTDRFHLFNTSFYPLLLKDTRRAAERVPSPSVKLFDKELIFLPICHELHWTLVIICHLPRAIRDSKNRKPFITICDSLALENQSSNRRNLVKILRNYLSMRYEWENNGSRVFSHVDIPNLPSVLPQQDNTCDCGVFLLEYTERVLIDYFSKYGKSGAPDVGDGGLPVRDRHWFTQDEVAEKRVLIRSILERMAIEAKDTEMAIEESLNQSSASLEMYSQNPCS